MSVKLLTCFICIDFSLHSNEGPRRHFIGYHFSFIHVIGSKIFRQQHKLLHVCFSMLSSGYILPEMMHFLGFPDLQLTGTDKLWIPLYAPPVPQMWK